MDIYVRIVSNCPLLHSWEVGAAYFSKRESKPKCVKQNDCDCEEMDTYPPRNIKWSHANIYIIYYIYELKKEDRNRIFLFHPSLCHLLRVCLDK